MTKEELFSKGLPKWPALVVKGKPVTEDQAKEIIVRTDGFCFSCNDREWEKEINEIIYGVRGSTFGDLEKSLKERHNIDEKDWSGYYDVKDTYTKKYSVLGGLNYITNSRIASSWIGGPHGWCAWNGRIGCSNYNIGKWPSVESVYNEWVIIAEAFPFLELKCQLMDSEAGENEEPKPVVEYEIKNGKVKIYEPKDILDYPVFGSEDMIRRFTDPHAERGCSSKTLKEAFEFVAKKMEVDKQIEKKEIWKEVK
jgi:hypothetical protein